MRSIRRNAFEKLARLSAQSHPADAAQSQLDPTLERLYKRFPNGSAARKSVDGAESVSVASVRMVRSPTFLANMSLTVE